MSFAEGTTVPIERSRAEIEKLVTKYGASEFSSGWSGTQAAVQFVASGRRVRFILELPNEEYGRELLFNRKRSPYYSRAAIPASEITKVVDAEGRRRWRCLLLAIKAKLEVVESGIASFDEEFLAHIVIDDRTVFDRIVNQAIDGKKLLPPVSS